MNMIETFVIDTSGCTYSDGKTIMFEILQGIARELYLCMMIKSKGITKTEYVFTWQNIPEKIRQIYDNVNKSSLFYNNVLYGPHLYSFNEKILYVIEKFNHSPIGEYKYISSNNIDNFTSIYDFQLCLKYYKE